MSTDAVTNESNNKGKEKSTLFLKEPMSRPNPTNKIAGIKTPASLVREGSYKKANIFGKLKRTNKTIFRIFFSNRLTAVRYS